MISVGELKSTWRGLWQFGGGRIVVNRAKEADIPFDGASERVRISVGWVAGNEAVAAKANHAFRLRIFRANQDGSFTEVASATKHVSVDGKGLGGTKFKNGSLATSEFTITEMSVFFIVYEVENENSKDVHRTRSWVRFVRKH